MTKDTVPYKAGELFLTFFKIGAFTFGGGQAMIPLMQKEAVEHKKWISDGEMLDMVVIAESTPGPIAVNMATFVGQKTAGFFGAVCATSGVVLPSFLIIIAVSLALGQIEDMRWVRYAFAGIKAGVLALLVKGLYTLYKQCPKGAVSYIVTALSFALVLFLKINPLWVIAGCILFGAASSLAAKRRQKR